MPPTRRRREMKEIKYKDRLIASSWISDLAINRIVPRVGFSGPRVLSGAAATTFHIFLELPVELQRNIWQWYGRIHARTTPNVIKIFKHTKTELAEGPLPRGVRDRKSFTVSTRSQAVEYKLPPIFFVCRLSFLVAKELYEKEYQAIPMGTNDKQVTYYNGDKDVIVLESFYVLQDWRYNRQTDSESKGLVPVNPMQAAQEVINRRINVRHLVIDGMTQSPLTQKLLGRFYDCKSIILGTNRKVRDEGFSTSELHKADRLHLLACRDTLFRYWAQERAGNFVREDYRGKETRSVVVQPSWDPSETTISNPVLFFWDPYDILLKVEYSHPAIRRENEEYDNSKSTITFINDFKFSHDHVRQFENPWRTYLG
ncbi:08c29611-9b3b-4c57-a6b5-70e8e162df37 [Sclerotinia trifoliorum]|uniref:08c29611-9b3b-4c57-a6b5-70e8e162df37 n=1 Tax=Sclerotinia trifoliorum TaxID=28548 RepID=A0A8H2ZSS9_9HELO|nr:08c29611-9b3b-4c57-a6b5-70e8e162df37 [Sclerotinia trifoliorum]